MTTVQQGYEAMQAIAPLMRLQHVIVLGIWRLIPIISKF